MIKFEEKLVKAREKKQLSLREAAAFIGISHTYLSALEKGFDPRTGKNIIPSQQVLLKICKAYGFDYDRVFASFSLPTTNDFYVNIGYQLKNLRKSEPDKFKKILEIIYSD